MNDHVTLTSVVDPPVVPDAVMAQGMALARESAMDRTATDRTQIMVSSMMGCEIYAGRMLFRGSTEGGRTGARTSTAEVQVTNAGWPLNACPALPDVSGVDVAVTSVELWDEDAGAYQADAPAHRRRPGGLIVLEQPGDYRVVAVLTAPATVDPQAVEAVARLFAFQERLRPGNLIVEGVGVQGGLQGALRRSGAIEVLDDMRNRRPM